MKARKEAEFWLADAFQLDDKTKRETAIERIRARMSSDKPDEVRAGAIAFVQLGPVEFDKASFRPIVRKLLSSPDVTTRKAAAEAFAITGAEPEDLQRIYALAGDPATEVRSGLTHVIVQLTNSDLTSPEATAAIGKLMDSLPRDPRDVAHALWGAKLSPQLESRVLEYCKDISGSGPGYDFFYGALSTQANKSEAGVKRLIEILADPDVTNRAGRAAWGLQQGVAREQYPLVADAMLKLIEARSEGYLRNEALTCLGNYGDNSHIAKLEALLAKPGVTGEFRKKLEVILSKLRSVPTP
jgi:HEAT repeat protein